jgi:peptidyl-prolyl cis-trans isomerase D
VIRLKKTTKAPAATNYDGERSQMLSQARGGIQSGVRTALQKRAEVLDNRNLMRFNVQR